MAEEPSKDISKAADSPDVIVALKGALQASLEESPEILTGILGSLLPQALVPIRLFHAQSKGRFLKQLMVEFEEFRKKGKINEDYLKSDQAWSCLSDVLDCIDKTAPDPKRYEAIKNAFLRSLISGKPGQESPYEQQMLRVICDLSAGEIVVLATVYKMGTNGPNQSAEGWQMEVANASGVRRHEIVAGIEDALMKKRLILPRKGEKDVITAWGQHNRLTTLGQEICERIQKL